jgi:hypothetical protein
MRRANRNRWSSEHVESLALCHTGSKVKHTRTHWHRISNLCRPSNLHHPPHSRSYRQPLSRPRQLPHKLPQIPLRSIFQVLFQRPLVLLAVSPLHANQQPTVPVQSHEARDEVVVADVFDRVVQQQGVAGRAVDDAVENVGYYFALG